MSEARDTYDRKKKWYRFWVGNPKGKRPLGKTRGRWEDNVKVDLTDIIYGGVEYIYFFQDKKNWRAGRGGGWGGGVVKTATKLLIT
jgi:hypothetical protein